MFIFENKNSIMADKDNLLKGLSMTKESILKKISRIIIGKSKIDPQLLDDLEESLISADVGVDTTIKIIRNIENRISKEKYTNINELNRILKEEIENLLKVDESLNINEDFFASDLPKPYVILIVGVNGVGKTTTIGKLANRFKKSGKSVILGAADTFRAAAIDQLTIWAERAGVDLIKQQMGADPASVAYDTVNSAKSKNYDVAIIDTAGRLHNKQNLMNELGKIKNVIKKIVPDGPHEVVLVLDASTGQNAFEQARQFTAVTDVNAIAITKLDGTAKGGVVIGISEQFNVPIKYIGTGEGIDDIQIFNKKEFVESLFEL